MIKNYSIPFFQSFNEYIGTLVNVQKDNNRKALIVRNEIEWSPQFYALLRYGSLTSWRQWWMWLSNIVGVPENFLGELFLYLANSRFRFIFELIFIKNENRLSFPDLFFNGLFI